MCGLYVRPSPWASGRKEIHPHIAKCAFLRLEIMNQLIKIESREIGQDVVQTVNARDLHAFLEVRRDFSAWIKGRIDQYEFWDGQDFIYYSAPQNGGAGNRGSRIEYMLSLDMAKELAMVERSAKGKEVRQYFIECERQAKAVSAEPIVPTSLSGALRLAADQAEQIEQQQAALALAAPKVDAFERIADSSGSMTIREAAKDLGLPPGVLGDWLKANRWIYKQGKTNLAFEPRITSGLMVHKVTVLELEDEDGTPRTKSVSQPRITPKGLARLALEVPGARS